MTRFIEFLRVSRILGRFRLFFRDQSGNATIEFLIWFPLFITLFLTSFELSMYSMRTILLERALDISLRQFRIGDDVPETQDEFRSLVCSNLIFSQSCTESLVLELQEINTDTWDLPFDTIQCVERSDPGAPQTGYSPKGPGVPMLVAACMTVEPFLGSTPFMLNLNQDESGAMQIIALSIYIREPT